VGAVSPDAVVNEGLRRNAAGRKVVSATDQDFRHIGRSGCGGRLQRALVAAPFRRHCGTTPMAAWRRIRLEAAHAALVRANGAASIAGIAAGYGFSNPGRFAKLLREAFGQSPTQVLRQTAPE
jgi:hypothetical protein